MSRTDLGHDHASGREEAPPIWVLICGDMLVFGLLFCVFILYRNLDPAGFDASQTLLNRRIGLANTLLLLTSSYFVVRGVRAARQGMASQFRLWFFGAVACGVGFIFDKFLEYSHLFPSLLQAKPTDFLPFFFVMTGVHLLHLVLGMGALIYAIAHSRQARPEEPPGGLAETVGLFWHLVDLLWLVLFALLYLAR